MKLWFMKEEGAKKGGKEAEVVSFSIRQREGGEKRPAHTRGGGEHRFP